MRRIENLDIMRGLAAFAVLLAHATVLGQEAISPIVTDVPSLLVHVGASSVWLFFGLSGFVISIPFVRSLLDGERRTDLGRYTLRRVARIYPLYLVCVPVAVVFGAGWAGADRLGKIAHVTLLHNLVPGRQQAFIPVSWTLTLEVIFYAAVPVVALALHHANRRRPISADRLALLVLVGAAGSVVLLAVTPLVVNDPIRQLWLRQSFPAMASMFAPGILLAILHLAPSRSLSGRAFLWIREHRAMLTVGAALGVVLGAALAAVDVPVNGPDWRLIVWDTSRHAYALGYGLLVARVSLARDWTFNGVAAFRHLGSISYGVYLLHGVFLLVLIEHPWLVPLGHPGLATYFLHAVYLGVVTIAVSTLSWRYLERPISDAARLRFRRKAPVV